LHIKTKASSIAYNLLEYSIISINFINFIIKIIYLKVIIAINFTKAIKAIIIEFKIIILIKMAYYSSYFIDF